MEVHLVPDVEEKPGQMARDTGRRSDELIEDAVIGLFKELAYTREVLERRYDDLESGRVQPIDGEEAYRRLMEKTEEQRRHRPTEIQSTAAVCSAVSSHARIQLTSGKADVSAQIPGYALHPEAFNDIGEIREHIADGLAQDIPDARGLMPHVQRTSKLGKKVDMGVAGETVTSVKQTAALRCRGVLCATSLCANS